MTSKEIFIEKLKTRILERVIPVHDFCALLPKDYSFQNSSRLLIRSSASTAVNHRAACRARSDREFFSKMSIVVEEADESEFWLTLIAKRKTLCDLAKLNALLIEILELVKILSKARSIARGNS